MGGTRVPVVALTLWMKTLLFRGACVLLHVQYSTVQEAMPSGAVTRPQGAIT